MENLVTPKVNGEIWPRMNRKIKSQDVRLQINSIAYLKSDCAPTSTVGYASTIKKERRGGTIYKEFDTVGDGQSKTNYYICVL